jgi:S-adenosylmethionine synthetase
LLNAFALVAAFGELARETLEMPWEVVGWKVPL